MDGLIGIPTVVVVLLAAKVYIHEVENVIHLHHPEAACIVLGIPRRQTTARQCHVQVLVESIYDKNIKGPQYIGGNHFYLITKKDRAITQQRNMGNALLAVVMERKQT